MGYWKSSASVSGLQGMLIKRQLSAIPPLLTCTLLLPTQGFLATPLDLGWPCGQVTLTSNREYNTNTTASLDPCFKKPGSFQILAEESSYHVKTVGMCYGRRRCQQGVGRREKNRGEKGGEMETEWQMG